MKTCENKASGGCIWQFEVTIESSKESWYGRIYVSDSKVPFL